MKNILRVEFSLNVGAEPGVLEIGEPGLRMIGRQGVDIDIRGDLDLAERVRDKIIELAQDGGL